MGTAVNAQGKPDFSEKVGFYTGGYNKGEAGSLVVSNPVNGKVYAYGQKDYRKSKGYEYVKFVDGEFIPVDKRDLMEAITA